MIKPRLSFWSGALLFSMLATVLIFNRQVPRGSIVPDPKVQIIPIPLMTEQVFPVEITLKNQTNCLVTLLGSPNFCGDSGCVSSSGLPMTLEPGGIARVPFVLKAGEPGAFDLDLLIYSDFPGQTEVHTRLKGVVASQSRSE